MFAGHGGRPCPPSETDASARSAIAHAPTPFALRDTAKAQIQIVGHNADGEERSVGLKCTAGHVFHARADLQILGSRFSAFVAALALPLHRQRGTR